MTCRLRHRKVHKSRVGYKWNEVLAPALVCVTQCWTEPNLPLNRVLRANISARCSIESDIYIMVHVMIVSETFVNCRHTRKRRESAEKYSKSQTNETQPDSHEIYPTIFSIWVSSAWLQCLHFSDCVKYRNDELEDLFHVKCHLISHVLPFRTTVWLCVWPA